jgi:hypothetical protein
VFTPHQRSWSHLGLTVLAVTVSAVVVVVVSGLWMRYADFRKLGMFTGSGAIEGGINAIVIHRAKQFRHAPDHWRRCQHHGPALPAR